MLAGRRNDNIWEELSTGLTKNKYKIVELLPLLELSHLGNLGKFQKLVGSWSPEVIFRIGLISNPFNHESKDCQDSSHIISKKSPSARSNKQAEKM